VTPLGAQSFKVQFTASRSLRDKLKQAQELMRHRVPDGDLAPIVERAIDLLIAQVKKERFAVGRKLRVRRPPPDGHAAAPWDASEPQDGATSRHIPDDLKRDVFERDEGCCTFIGDDGRRCGSRDGIEYDHVKGFAIAKAHRAEDLRLVCRAHNQRLADRLYGRAFMDRLRGRGTRPGACSAATIDAPARGAL
jgi:hypothetical protein